MLVVDNPRELKVHIGKTLEPSDWITVDQAMIDAFADATGDHQWIHVDVERAKRELPAGTTIAHGYLTLSLLPRMMQQTYRVRNHSQSINYGSNRIRFANAVPAGARVRLQQTIKSVEDIAGGGARVTAECVVEIEGEERPALVAEIISLVYA